MSTKSELQYVRKEGRLKETSLDCSLSQMWSFHGSITGKKATRCTAQEGHRMVVKKKKRTKAKRKKKEKKKVMSKGHLMALIFLWIFSSLQTEEAERISKQIKIES